MRTLHYNIISTRKSMIQLIIRNVMITLLTHICDIPVFSILILILMITKLIPIYIIIAHCVGVSKAPTVLYFSY